MLKSLRVKNFRCWPDATIEFHPNINAFIGDSNAGKTALVTRSLAWVLTNRPLSDGMIRWGQKEAEVEIRTENHSVTRVRGKTQNRYIVDGVSFEAMRGDIPEQVTAALNLAEINIQTQLERPFLVMDTPGFVAGYVNEITHLDQADGVVSVISRRISQVKGEQEGVGLERDRVATELKAPLFQMLDDFERLVVSRKEFKDKLDTVLAASVELGQCLTAYESATFELEGLSWVLTADVVAERLKGLLNTRDRQAEVCSELQGLVEGVLLADNALAALDKTVRQRATVDALAGLLDERAEIETELESVRGLILQLERTDTELGSLVGVGQGETVIALSGLLDAQRQISEGATGLAAIICQVEALDKDYRSSIAVLKGLTKERDELVSQVSECPLCGSELDDTKRERVLEGVQ